MKTNKSLLILAIIAITLSSCSRGCQYFSRNIADNHKQYVNIKQYSGGILINEWDIYGIINNSDKSDGYYFYDREGKLIEISGDITLTYKKQI